MRALIVAVLAVGVCHGSASAQVLPLKRGELAALRPGECPVLRIPEPAQPPSTTVTDSLLAAGSQAAILGDQAAARDLLGQAAAQDPRNPVASYRLARTLDEIGDSRSALVEYCRYLNLAPNGAEAGSIRSRVGELVAAGTPLPDDPWARAMLAAVEMYEAGQNDLAVASFTAALETRPNSADAVFNRGLARLAAGDTASAAADWRAYLDMVPQAEDRGAVLERLALLEPAPALTAAQPIAVRQPARMASPGAALVEGLIIPGLGQYATGRTFLGVMVLGAAGGAVYFGTRTELGTRTQTALDPFGNEYQYEAQVLERPNLIPGIGAAAGIALIGAIESFLYARRFPRAGLAYGRAAPVSDRSAPIDFTLLPDTESFRIGLSLRIGAR